MSRCLDYLQLLDFILQLYPPLVAKWLKKNTNELFTPSFIIFTYIFFVTSQIRSIKSKFLNYLQTNY